MLRSAKRTCFFLIFVLGSRSVIAQSINFDCSSVTAVPVQECIALLDLYIESDGDNWNSNNDWLVNLDVCAWDRVYCKDSHVTGLDMRSNNLRGIVPESFGNLVELESVRFDRRNYLTGPIPSSIGNLKKLKSIKLGGTGNVFDGIPPEIGSATSLEEIQMTGCDMPGPIPPEIGNLKKLKYLYLDSNKLTSIPEELSQCSSLKSFSMRNNDLRGPLPTNLGELTELESFRVDKRNFLTGPIPSSIGNLKKLKSMKLGDGSRTENRFSGGIPAEIGGLSSVEEIHMVGCGLTGPIPPQIGQLKNMKGLYLDYNNLTAIPNEIGECYSLESLQLRRNTELTGEIPRTLMNLNSLNSFGYDRTIICQPNDEDPAFQDFLGKLSGFKNDVICEEAPGVSCDVENPCPNEYCSCDTIDHKKCIDVEGFNKKVELCKRCDETATCQIGPQDVCQVDVFQSNPVCYSCYRTAYILNGYDCEIPRKLLASDVGIVPEIIPVSGRSVWARRYLKYRFKRWLW